MENLRIATWNIKNSYFNTKVNDDKARAICGLLEIWEPDFLTLQEVNPLLACQIEEKLKESESKYKITTDYAKNKNLVKNIRVEYNMIISHLEPESVMEKNKLPSLPKGFKLLTSLPSIRMRNMTSQSFPGVFINTTHLDHAVKELGKRQMEEIISELEIQTKVNPNTVLTGTLNSKPIEKNMIDFTKSLSSIGMQVVENPHRTYDGHFENQPVDYIIVPSHWEVENVETIEYEPNYSSHYPVLVDVKKKIKEREPKGKFEFRYEV